MLGLFQMHNFSQGKAQKDGFHSIFAVHVTFSSPRDKLNIPLGVLDL